MNYNDALVFLEKDLSTKAEQYMKVEQALIGANFHDMPSYFKIKDEWQKASNKFWGLLSYIEKLGIDPESEIASFPINDV